MPGKMSSYLYLQMYYNIAGGGVTRLRTIIKLNYFGIFDFQILSPCHKTHLTAGVAEYCFMNEMLTTSHLLLLESGLIIASWAKM